MYLDELQFIFKRGDRGGVMRYLFFWYTYIYRQCRQTYGHSKRLQTMNTTNLRAQLNRNFGMYLLFTWEDSKCIMNSLILA